MWVWGGGCRCGEVGVVVVMENPTPVQNFTARLYHFIFVCPISYFRSWLCGLLNKLKGVGGGWWCGEVGVGVGRWVWGGGYGCAEVGVGRWVWVWL